VVYLYRFLVYNKPILLILQTIVLYIGVCGGVVRVVGKVKMCRRSKNREYFRGMIE